LPALPSNFYRTPHGYLFCIVVREALRAAIGKREIKKSLGKDYRAAVSQVRLLVLRVDTQFAELLKQQVQQRQDTDSLEAYLEVKPGKWRLEPITKVTVPLRLARHAEAELLRRFAPERLSFDTLLIQTLREQAQTLKVDWDTVL